jgi:hypothetical protein
MAAAGTHSGQAQAGAASVGRPMGVMPSSTLRLIVGGLAALVVLGGCGASKPKPDTVNEQRLVAEANALCGSWAHRPRPTREREALRFQGRLATITKALRQAAAYLPAGRAWNAADAERRELFAERNKLLRSRGGFLSGQGGPPDFIDRLSRLQVQIYGDVKALGLTSCLGPPPRPPVSG